MATKQTAKKTSKPCEPKPYKTWKAVLKAKADGDLPRGTRIVEDATGFGVYSGAKCVFATTFVAFTADVLKASGIRVVRDG